jgi:hypothetical protein
MNYNWDWRKPSNINIDKNGNFENIFCQLEGIENSRHPHFYSLLSEAVSIEIYHSNLKKNSLTYLRVFGWVKVQPIESLWI